MPRRKCNATSIDETETPTEFRRKRLFDVLAPTTKSAAEFKRIAADIRELTSKLDPIELEGWAAELVRQDKMECVVWSDDGNTDDSEWTLYFLPTYGGDIRTYDRCPLPFARKTRSGTLVRHLLGNNCETPVIARMKHVKALFPISLGSVEVEDGPVTVRLEKDRHRWAVSRRATSIASSPKKPRTSSTAASLA